MENLNELVAQAKEAVKNLEEPLKTKGFEVILTKLLNSKFKDEPQEKIKKISVKQQLIGKDKNLENICSSINRTKFPKIYKLNKALDRALYVLKIVRETSNVEGLLPLQISKILNSVFRLKTTAASINMALGEAKTYVNRKPIKVQGGQGYQYFLMHDGEEYLRGILKNAEDK